MQPIHRRGFLKFSAGMVFSSLVPCSAFGSVLKRLESRRSLSFFNIHTAEHLSVCYHENGAYLPEALESINHLLRDFRADETRPIDPQLLDVLYQLRGKTGQDEPFHVISGYRSPKTNAMLRRRTAGVAKSSLHTKGRAVDIRLPGCATSHLRDLCIEMRAGGVGYYAQSDFVHIDTGQVRSW